MSIGFWSVVVVAATIILPLLGVYISIRQMGEPPKA